MFKSIRFKTLFVMTISVLVLFLFTLAITSGIISTGFQEIENNKVRENLVRVSEAYSFDLDNLSTKLSDWSSWDDTYKYISDKNQAFVDSNLVYSTLANLRINFMAFVDTNGVVVKQIGIDPGSRAGINGLPQDLEMLISTGSAITSHKELLSETKGLLLLRDGPLMFVSRPILDSNGRGPIAGSVVFAKYLDDANLKNISDVVHVPLSVARVDRDLPEDFQSAFNGMDGGSETYLSPLNISLIRGYGILKDFYGKPALVYRIEYPRDITNEGAKSVSIFFYSFIITGFVFLLVLAFFLNKFLIHRIERLSSEVERVGFGGSAGRVVVDSLADEITSLSNNINRMLDSLSITQNAVTSEKAKVDTFFDIVSGIVVVVSIGGKILSMNKKGCEFLGLTEENAIGRDWLSYVPEKDREWVRKVFNEIVMEDKIGKYEYLESPVLDRQGNAHLFGWYNSVLRDGKGQVVAYVSHGENVSKIGVRNQI